MKKPIFTLFCAFLLTFSLIPDLVAQPNPTTIFTFDSISIAPANPTPTELVSITVFGTKLDSCVYLDYHAVNVGVNTVNINFGFQIDPPPVHVQCGPASIPFDTTFVVGPFPPSVYSVVLTGPLTSSTIPSQDLIFIVAPVDCHDTNGDIWVTSTQDAGPGTLRAAIDCANATPGPNLIRFHIPSTLDQKIRIGFSTGLPLPTLTDPGTTIDGTTQPGFGDNGDFSPKIILDGAFYNWTAPINALFIQGNECKVFALEIINFPDDAIDVLDADNVIIGLPGAGNYIYNNGWPTDFFPDAPPGSGPWEGCGVVVRGNAQGCQILGNVIGTNENMDGGLGNEWCAIYVRDNAHSCNIGGPSPGQENILMGNVTGVRVNGANNCLIQNNNFICNEAHGIELVNGANNGILSPQISTALTTQIMGTTSTTNISVEVYINDATDCIGAPCQGRHYLGSTTVVNGQWTLNAPFPSGITLTGGERITAVAEDGTETSEFSECKVVAGVSACTNVDGSIVVTSTDDEGPGTLREAIECANSTVGANYIHFNIPGPGPHTIFVGEANNEALPSLTDEGTVIDGTTQPGFGANGNNPQIILDGQIPTWALPINALFIRADYCEVYALQIVNFPDDGIDITAANHCVIGDVGKGNVIYSNGDEQDFFPGSPNTGPWNGCGIVLKNGSSYNQIKSNTIGTDIGGTLLAGNEYCGIIIQSGSDHNSIGGTEAGEGNAIADNEQGIQIQSNTIGNSIHQNEIFCNTISGINLTGTANNSIAAPSITEAATDTIRGSATGISGVVEVFINNDQACAGAPCQGKTYLGTATINSGNWTLLSPFANGMVLNGGESLTAVTISNDGNSSEFASCIAVEIPCAILANVVDQQDATCGLPNGSTTIGATGGILPYTYDIGNGPGSNPTFSNLASGDYFITVTDMVGCSALVETSIGDSPVPVLTIGVNNDATCAQANGSFSAQASNGTGNFTYDIGNGSQTDTLFTGLAAGTYSLTATDALGCTADLSVIINDNGLPVVTIAQMTNPTCGLNNGSVTAAVTGGTPPYTYDIGNGPVNDPAFSGLAPNDYSINVSDANGCTAMVGAVLVNQGVLPVASFTYVDVDGTVSFTNTSMDGVSYVWDFGDGSTSAEENPTHTYVDDGDYSVCLTVTNACGTDAACQLLSIVIPLAEATISGFIAKENGDEVSLVEINCTGAASQTTLSDGYYEFGGMSVGGNYTIQPSKNVNHRNGISVLDLVLIQRHLLLMDTLDSPYKIIAADASNNRQVGVSDLVILQRLILLDLDTFPNNTSWRFVAADFVFTDPVRPFNSIFPEVLEVNNLMMDMSNQDFVAIKVGDVSGNANPAQLNNAVAQLLSPDQDLKANTEINVVLRSSDFQHLSAWQSDFYFEPDKLELVGVTPGELSGITWGDSHLDQGLLPVVWYDELASADGINVAAEADILTLTFRVLSSGGLLSDYLHLKPGVGRNLLLDNRQQEQPVTLVFDRSTGLTEQGATTFQLAQNEPNPFAVMTEIPFVLPQAGEVELLVYDIAGRLVSQQKASYPSGKQRIVLPISDLPGMGLYFYEMRYEGQKAIRRMVVD